MPAIKSYTLTTNELVKILKSKEFRISKVGEGLGDLKSVEASKLNYLVLSEVGAELYLLATVLPKKLETRFVIGGNARNDRFHLNGFKKAIRPIARFKQLKSDLLPLLKQPSDLKLKSNTTQHYVSSFSLPLFIAFYKATRQKELNDSGVNAHLKEVYDKSTETYHQGTGDSLLSDSTYDKLRIYLIKLGIVKSTEVGAAPAPTSKKVELKTPLGSLENAFDDTQLSKFFSKFKVTSYIHTPKIDGISAQVNYVKGVLTSGNTKGDGYIGEDITKLLKMATDVPKKLTKPVTISIRCELFMKDSVFEKKYGRNSGREKPFANARNMVAGLKNRKDPDPKVAKDLSVLGYEILNKLIAKSEQLKELKTLGFPVVPYVVAPLKGAGEAFSKFRSSQDYKQDGSVVELDDPKYRSGFIGSGINPNFSVAYKPETEEAETTVTGEKWTISKDGYFNPTIYVEPVVVEGARVSKISVHNAKKVKDLGLGVGARIVVIRAGSAIPHVKEVLKPAKPKYPPGSNWTWNSTGVDIVLKEGENSEAKEIEKIITFFSALGVERFSEGLIKSFYQHGFKTIPDILHMTKEQIIKEVPRQGDTSAQNIITEFAKLKSPGVLLPELLYASGCFGRGLGQGKFKDLYTQYGSDLVTGWQGSTLADIATSIDEIPGFSYETGKQFAQGIKPFIAFYKSVKDVIYIKRKKTIDKGVLSGQILAFSGFRNKEWANKIESLGGTYSDSVTSKTTILVSDISSEKTKKAQKNGTKIMSRKEFEKLLNNS